MVYIHTYTYRYIGNQNSAVTSKYVNIYATILRFHIVSVYTAYKPIYIRICIYIYICVCVYVCVCAYLLISGLLFPGQ